MSDTPRTDAVRIGPEHPFKYWEDFARNLEREITVIEKRYDEVKGFYGDEVKEKDSLRRQLTALATLVSVYLANSAHGNRLLLEQAVAAYRAEK